MLTGTLFFVMMGENTHEVFTIILGNPIGMYMLNPCHSTRRISLLDPAHIQARIMKI
jgi:hypothetical protein